jgi:hypothetical protein
MTTLEGKGSSKSSSGKGSKAAKSTPTKASKSSSGKGSASSKSAGSLPAPTPTAKSAVTHTPSAAPTRGSREETVTISYVIALTSGTDFDTVVADLIEAMNSLALNTVAEAVNAVGRDLMIQLIRLGGRRRLDTRVVLPTIIESAVVVECPPGNPAGATCLLVTHGIVLEVTGDTADVNSAEVFRTELVQDVAGGQLDQELQEVNPESPVLQITATETAPPAPVVTATPVPPPSDGSTLAPVTAPVVAPVSPPIAGSTLAPVSSPSAAPVPPPIAGSTSAPVTAPVIAPVATPVIAPVVAPVAPPIAGSTLAPVPPPSATPVPPPIAGSTLAPVTAPMVAPVTAPVVAPVTAPVVAPVTAPVVAPVTAPVVAPVTAPVVAPVTAPVVAPVTAPVVAPVTAPVVAPVTAPVVAPVTAPSAAPSRVCISTEVQLRDHIDNNIDGVLCANITVSLSSTVIIPQNADFDLSCGGNTCLILSALEIQLFRTEVTTASGNGHDVSFTGIIFEQALTTAAGPSPNGAAFGLVGGTTSFTDCNFGFNFALSDEDPAGDAPGGNGGAIAVSANGSVIVTNCLFLGNGSLRAGGAIAAFNVGSDANPTVTITNSRFGANVANAANDIVAGDPTDMGSAAVTCDAATVFCASGTTLARSGATITGCTTVNADAFFCSDPDA